MNPSYWPAVSPGDGKENGTLAEAPGSSVTELVESAGTGAPAVETAESKYVSEAVPTFVIVKLRGMGAAVAPVPKLIEVGDIAAVARRAALTSRIPDPACCTRAAVPAVKE